jgi:sulfite exporter TauE/SafE
MMALCLTVLGFSLAGSWHCAGMCGAFVAFAIGAGEPARAPAVGGTGGGRERRTWNGRTALLSLYQAGRLITYTLLGIAAGALGSGLNLTGQQVGLQQTAAVAAGALMVGFGAFTLLRLSGMRLKGLPVPSLLTKIVTAGHGKAMRYSPPARALATGLLTTLLPCGFLWAFVVLAAGTGAAWSGGLVMTMFWLGTLPVMSLVGIGIRRLSAPLAAKLPAVTASAIVIVGLYTIVARAHIVLPPIQNGQQTAATLIQQAGAVDHSTCCSTTTQSATTRPHSTGQGDHP